MARSEHQIGGAVPAHSRYGQPAPKYRQADGGLPSGAMGIGPPSKPSVQRSRMCVVCGKAYRAKGTDYCVGHLRQAEKAAEAADEKAGE